LSDELFKYARADTHFLLYIFDNMRNELVAKSNFSDPERNKVLDVLKKSRETALQRYEHPIYDTELGLGSAGWYKLIMRTPAQFTPQQFSVFRAVHRWRDNIGREEDESPMFIMPNHAVFSIARLLPVDKAALFNVTQHVSPILRARADELVAIIAKAKTEDGPDLNDTIKKISDLKFAERVQNGTAVAVPNPTRPTPAVPSAPLPATLDTPPLRAPVSSFWGSLFKGGAAEQKRPCHTLNVELALPLPPLTAEIFADNAGFGVQGTPKAEKPEHKFVPKEDRAPEDERTDIFVVKQLGGGRKRKLTEAVEGQPASPLATLQDDPMDQPENGVEADEINLDFDAEAEGDKSARQNKARKREARKKEAKQGKIAARAARASGEEEEEAFDYTTAPTVLRAADADRAAAHGGKKKRKDKKEKPKKDPNFNPYAKLTDAPKGLARSQKEGPGRSKTFSS
jgi:exosome complex exonuclease RRP6